MTDPYAAPTIAPPLIWCPGCRQDRPVNAWARSNRHGVLTPALPPTQCRSCRRSAAQARNTNTNTDTTKKETHR